MASFRRPTSSREPLSGAKLRERAFDLLSRRDHSVRELSKKLRDKGAPEEEIAPLLDDLKERGFLDDVKFAENFVRFRSGKAWGARRYRQELIQRGVKSDIVAAALEQCPELQTELVLEKLRRFMVRELAKGREEKKIIASYLRRGFSFGLVRTALEQVKSEECGEFD